MTPYTRRETEILALLWEGHDAESVGHQTGLKMNGVRSALFRMRAKAGVHTMAALAVASFKEFHHWSPKSAAVLAAETKPGCYGCRYNLAGHFGNCDTLQKKEEEA